jgi:ribokinase
MASGPIVCVGSINVDLVMSVSVAPQPGETVSGKEFHVNAGGKGANQAVAVARLGEDVRLIGAVGDDEFGRMLRRQLVKDGVDVRAVGTFSGSSGVATITVDASGENSIIVAAGANAAVTPEYLNSQRELLRGASLVLAQLEIPLDTVVHLARLCAQAEVPLMLDPAPAQTLPESVFPLVQWFTPNQTEAEFYLQERLLAPQAAAQHLLRLGCHGVILKMGANGALLANNAGMYEAQTYAVEVVDTTAAGDCFNGAFAVGIKRGMPAERAADFATCAAAWSVTERGAQSSMPTQAQVDKLMRTIARWQ